MQHDVSTPIPGEYSNAYIEFEESFVDTYNKNKLIGHLDVECSETDTEQYEMPIVSSLNRYTFIITNMHENIALIYKYFYCSPL